MIWIGLAILAALIGSIILIDWHLAQIKGGLFGLGQILATLHNEMIEANRQLREIARSADRIPKPYVPEDDPGPI